MKLGLHISTAGNITTTPLRARGMGADCIQIFASNPRGWRPTFYTEEQAASFKAGCIEAGISPVLIHMIYLVSYGAPSDDLRDKSIAALTQTLSNADQLGVLGVVTHLGSHKGLGLEQALKRLCSGISQALRGSQDSLVLLENSAGAGGNIGNSLEELAAIIEGMDFHPRVKICLDTAHLLGSGYDIRSRKGLDDFLKKFDTLIGLDRLAAFHLNDSKADLGSHIDRHENIGDGFIGLDGFKLLVNHPKLADIPGFMEVPGLDGKGPDAANLERLRALVKT